MFFFISEEGAVSGCQFRDGLPHIPLDSTNANLLRARVTAIIGAVNAQLRTDEQRLKNKNSNDVLDRLEKLIEEKKKAYPEWLSSPK
jgi:hypothetical protein